MKCKICGFRENEPNEEVCQQCGEPFSPNAGFSAPLEGDRQSGVDPSNRESDSQETRLGSGVEDRELTRKTVLGRTDENPNLKMDQTEQHCPNCGYLLRQGQTTCPNCNMVEPDLPKAQKAYSITSSTQGNTHTRRIEEFTPAVQGPTVRLEPVNGPHLPVIESREFPLTLKRKDFDPQDDSISAASHFSVFKEEVTGEWKVRNEATNQALFLQVEKETPIHSGAVILIGQHKLYRLIIED